MAYVTIDLTCAAAQVHRIEQVRDTHDAAIEAARGDDCLIPGKFPVGAEVEVGWYIDTFSHRVYPPTTTIDELARGEKAAEEDAHEDQAIQPQG